MLFRVGYSGYSWATAVVGTYAHNLNFNCGGVYPNDGSGRATGFPLRCLQE
ncbi:MAG: hypothetical protein K2K83_02975 [Rikenella sp.]|nr:hypothetical protein [Rikenella sp.]